MPPQPFREKEGRRGSRAAAEFQISFRPVALLALILSLNTFQSSGEPGVQQYLRQLDAYQVVKKSEMGPKEAPSGHLSEALWKECGLVSATAWEMREPDKRPFRLTVYESRHAAGAFSAYTLWKEGVGEPATQFPELRVENRFWGRELLFWKGSFLLHLIPPTDAVATNEAVLRLARSLVDTIALANVHPLTVVHLPRNRLIRDSVTFYLGADSLSTNPDLPAPVKRAVGFDHQAEVAFARYTAEGYPLFLLGYPTPALAADYFARLQNRLGDFRPSQGVYMKRSGVLVSLFVGPEEEARSILEEVQYAPRVKWVHEEDTSLRELEEARGEVFSFLNQVKESLLGTASLILAALVAGAIAGLLRYAYVSRFRPRRPKDDTIHLRLSDR